MSSIVYLKNKKNGTVYAYLNESVWDSEKKKCVCKRKCLGHLDPETGNIVPNKGHEKDEAASVRAIGATYFLDHVAESIGLTDALMRAFPENWKILLSCAYFILFDTGDMSMIEYWSRDNVTPNEKLVTTRELTDVFLEITENDMFTFHRAWRDTFNDESFYMFHTSSRSSFDTRLDLVNYNELPSLDLNTNTYLSIVFGSTTRIPISYGVYRMEPKSLTDLRKRMNDISWLDVADPLHILDAEYCTQENFDDLLRSNQHYLVRVSPDFPQARESIQRVKERIMDTKNMITVEGTSVFAMSFVNYHSGRKFFAHIIFNTEQAEQEFTLFLSLVEQCYNELLTNIYVPEHKTFYEKYFKVKETGYGRMVEEDGDAIMRFNDVAGFMVLFSNTIKDPQAACRHYFQKDRVQSNFENLKNKRDRGSLMLYSDQIYNGRLFVQFLSTILASEIRRRVGSMTLLKNIGYKELIHEMMHIKKVSIPGFNTPFFTSLNNTQTRIIRAFGIENSYILK